jgi:crotonobetainyl-CoA:carnitine CoA-transferase CaiB-like acyl-CoA transferase
VRTALDFAPKYGQHTRSVLAEAGLGERDIAALFDAGVAA